jgi:hypothetical protein
MTGPLRQSWVRQSLFEEHRPLRVKAWLPNWIDNSLDYVPGKKHNCLFKLEGADARKLWVWRRQPWNT